MMVLAVTRSVEGFNVLDRIVDVGVLVLPSPTWPAWCRPGRVAQSLSLPPSPGGSPSLVLDRVDGVRRPAVDEREVVGPGDLVLEHIPNPDVGRH